MEIASCMMNTASVGKNGNPGRESRIGFIGAGIVGKTLALALSGKGYNVVAVASRTVSSADVLAGLVPGCVAYTTPGEAAVAADLVFITTPDDVIGAVAEDVPWRRGQGVVHCSGVESLDVLEPARRRGAATGGFHPLQTFSSISEAVKSIPGSTFAIEGDAGMRTYLGSLARDLRGKPIFLRSEDKPLYHASVLMMSGFVTGLAAAMVDLWVRFGLDRTQALESLLPITEACTKALRSVGVPGAVTGPYVRGDTGTIRKHLDALRNTAPEALSVYCHMALTGLPYAFEKGKVTGERADEIRRLLVKAAGETDFRSLYYKTKNRNVGGNSPQDSGEG